mmetsp:Transcript_39970/g.80064  ORF Transcript_39970/g.80064 Transcript_39970/m.80064 type:complete len:333 (+) Transcript_39970:2804-3802(+)
MPPAPVPSTFLSSMPAKCSPLSMITRVSPTESSSFSSSGWPFANLLRWIFGRRSDMICLPVQSCFGFRMHGIGNVPVKLSRCNTKFITKSFSRNKSRRVKPREPSNVSWTMPITGLFDCGETMQRGTNMISEHSARVSCDCITCRFISSPSKSALYGEVTERFMRKVEYGRILIRWPMIDILCNDGCRLNMTMSPSCTWRSTLYPGCKWRCTLGMRKSSRKPSVRMMYRAPGSSSGPLLTNSCSFSRLNGVTISGKVSVRAMERGTPTSSMAKLGSGVITVRAEKSTRLPIKLPRIRPSLPLRRWEMLLRGRPVRDVAGACPGMLFSTKVAT